MILLMLAALAEDYLPDRPASLELERVEARLFYKGSGRLSDDLLNRAEPFVGWNSMIGEGAAEEIADDLLVAVRMISTDGDQKYVTGPATIDVRDAKGKVLASRTFRGVLTSKQGTVVLPLWLTDVGCAGDLNITARFNGKMKTGQLVLDCGE